MARRIPKKPTEAENTAPNRNATPREMAMTFRSSGLPSLVSHGHLLSTIMPVRNTSNTPTVVNCRQI